MFKMMNEKYCLIDTTLRDGAQSPLIMFSDKEKISIAEMLDKKGVYQIEAGIPAVGKAERDMIKEIKTVCEKAKISVWNRLNKDDIQASLECQADIIHISVPVSYRQIHDKLQKDEIWLMDKIEEILTYTVLYAEEITIGMEDASRADVDYMINIIKKVQQFGVKTVRFADTVGIMTPIVVFQQIKELIENTAINIEFHGHNDLGMAIANSIAAVEAGACFIDTTVNGIGERCGNCDMDKFIFAASTIFANKKMRG